MKVKPYEKVSAIFDTLMKKLDYESWSNYIIEIANVYIENDAKVLELGGGSCKIAEYISARYKNYIASDISFSMLYSSEKKKFSRICCDMTALPFKSEFDFIFSSFDSVNYILKQQSVYKLFTEVFRLLEREGVFTFDVSLEKNSLNFVVSKSVEGRSNGYTYQRISQYNKRSRIHSNHFYIRDEFGNEFKEVHKEKIYKIDTFFRLAERAGLLIEACYDCFTFNDVNENSERAQFVMRKIN
jgi:ubiquinone/menaquinone biosynthesis C-methylase UbiE